MKIAIVGSRDWPNAKAVIDYVNALPPDSVIVSGGALGVDTFAEIAAQKRGLEVEVYRADWAKYGKRAGMMRNADIVNAADCVVAFHYRASRGTANTINRARRAGKPVEVHHWNGRVETFNAPTQERLL